MKIVIAGTGYVGLVTGTCFADMGIEVVCVDIDERKIENLRRGLMPIYEPGLEEMVVKNHNAGRLKFSTRLSDELADAQAVFCAVGTPPGEDGGADLQYVLEVARTVGRHMDHYLLFVTKSTVPVGSSAKVKAAIGEELALRGVDIPFDVASNPEFLKEGAAIDDFMHPDRVVVGVESDRAQSIMERIYHPFMLNNYRLIYTDIPSAEMIKYAANAMLATRISFMNDMANLCELVGADVNMVRKGIGSDTRIGSQFLYPGCGYGGSCFPKDVKALIRTADQAGYDMQVLKAVDSVNERQKSILFRKLEKHFPQGLAGKTVALWGLSFKPETDDMREAPSLAVIDLLLRAGAAVKAYDPIAMDEARHLLGDSITYSADKYEAAAGADALLLVTEWKEFRIPDWERLRRTMCRPLVIDGRNIYRGGELAGAGMEYDNIGALTGARHTRQA